MRDLIITAIVFGLLPFILSRVHWGVYLMAWLGYMNPNRLAYGFAYSMPFVQIVVLVTLAALFISKEKKRMVWSAETLSLIILIAWMGITTIFALYPDMAQAKYINVLKIQVITILTLLVLTTRQKVHIFIWIIALSIGYYGVKGGIFTILTGGSNHVWGPLGSFIGGNNELALALIMTVPLIRYLQLNENNKWIKRGLGLALILCIFSIIGSQSRGALLGLLAMGSILWYKSSAKLATTLLLATTALIIIPTMPDEWFERMDTIKNYEEDDSALQRLNTWKLSTAVANDRITGGGFQMYTPAVYKQYAERPEWVFDSHSIYFQMLGEHGYIGLALLIIMLALAWKKCSRIIKISQVHPDLKWAKELAAMIQVSLVGYCTAGAFLGLAYFDYIYHLIAVVIVVGDIIERNLKENNNTILKNNEAQNTTKKSMGFIYK